MNNLRRSLPDYLATFISFILLKDTCSNYSLSNEAQLESIM